MIGVFIIKTIQAYYDGSAFIPLAPVEVKQNQPVLITVLEFNNEEVLGNHYDDYFGMLSDESLLEITEALKDTERVDTVEW